MPSEAKNSQCDPIENVRVNHSSRLLARVMAVFFTLILVSFILNAFFAHPWTDDFVNSVIARSKGFIDAQIYWYTHWSGRYTTYALMSVNPLVYGLFGWYKLVIVTLLLLLVSAAYALLSVITGDTVSRWHKYIMSVMVISVYLDQMPDIRSGLYWISGSVTYQTGIILLMVLSASIIAMKEKEIHSCSAVIIASCILLPGTNEVVMLLTLLTLFLTLLLDFYNERFFDRAIISMFLLVICCSYVSVSAPGNIVRLSTYQGSKDILFTLQSSLQATIKLISLWIGSPLVLGAVVFVWISVYRNEGLKQRLRSVPIIITASGMFCMMFCSFVPVYWSTGMYPDVRVINIVYFVFLAGILLNSALFASRVSFGNKYSVSGPVRILCGFLLSAYILISYFFASSNFLSVSSDLVSGKSRRFNEEMKNRYHALSGNISGRCTIDSLKNMPASLFFADIYFTDDNWINSSYAEYFGKQSIILRRPVKADL